MSIRWAQADPFSCLRAAGVPRCILEGINEFEARRLRSAGCASPGRVWSDRSSQNGEAIPDTKKPSEPNPESHTLHGSHCFHVAHSAGDGGEPRLRSHPEQLWVRQHLLLSTCLEVRLGCSLVWGQ